MADEPTIEEAKAALELYLQYGEIETRKAAYRTLLASYASLEERVKEAPEALRLAEDILWWALHEIERLRERNAEVNMLAHGWMAAHDMLAAGKPYKLPTPADLPDALSSAERRIEDLVRVEEENDQIVSDLLHKLDAAESLVTTLKAEVEELKRRPDMLKQLLDAANAAHFDATMRADAAESRLASPTGQVEDAASEKVVAWMIQHSIATGHGDTLDDLLGELSAYVRKMQAEIERLSNRFQRATEDLAELRVALASLTGQVEDMRERAAKVADEIEDRYAREWRAGHKSNSHMEGMSDGAGEVAAAIRSLPVLPATGDGGGPEPEDRK